MTVQRVTLIGVIANVLLGAAKLVAGILGRSSALIADAVHSISDLITDVAVLWGAVAAQRPADEDHAFGHGRFETIAAFLVAGSLLVGSVGIATPEIVRLVSRAEPEVPRAIALWVALVSIAVKEALYHLTQRVARRTGSPAAGANAWHHRSDALSSVAASLGVGSAMLFGGNALFLDSVAAILVALMVGYVGARIGRDALLELSDVALGSEERAAIDRIIRDVDGASDPHGLRTRRLGRTAAIEVHFRVDGSMSVEHAHEIASQVEGLIKDRFGADTRVITHVEPTFAFGARAAGTSTPTIDENGN